jgi:hypothetical protein
VRVTRLLLIETVMRLLLIDNVVSKLNGAHSCSAL